MFKLEFLGCWALGARTAYFRVGILEMYDFGNVQASFFNISN